LRWTSTLSSSRWEHESTEFVMISFKVSAQESKPVKSQTAVLASNFQRPAGALGKVETWHTAVALFSLRRGGHEM